MPRPVHVFGLSEIAIGNLVSFPYICKSCRHLALRKRLASLQSLRHASSDQIPFTEKVRRKIWDTDNRLGLADLYDGESFLDKRRKEQALQKEAEERNEPGDEHAPSATWEQSGRIPQTIEQDADNDYVSKTYVPAETWDGLEHVGHKGHWRDIAPRPEDRFDPFLASGQLKASRPEHFLAAIHQATVEIITLEQAGKDLNLSTYALRGWDPEIKELIARTNIEIRAGEIRPTLTYPTENTKGIILGWFLKRKREALQEAEPSAVGPDSVSGSLEASENFAADAQEVDEATDISGAGASESSSASAGEGSDYDTAEVDPRITAEDGKPAERQRREFEVQHGCDREAQVAAPLIPFYDGVEAPAFGADQPFLDMKLNFNDDLTYFLFRRITQLTGFRIPDPVLAKAKTLRSIYIYQLQTIKPKPKNLAETLATRSDLASLPNVKIMRRRETPVDKEKAVGRWKVIEAELRSRGLPVLGRAEA